MFAATIPSLRTVTVMRTGSPTTGDSGLHEISTMDAINWAGTSAIWIVADVSSSVTLYSVRSVAVRA